MIAIVHDDAGVAAEVEAILRHEGFETIMLDDAARVRATVQQARLSAVVLVNQHQQSTVVWNALQILWLDRMAAHLPLILCLRETDELRPATARLRGKRCILLPMPTQADTLVTTLAAAVTRAASEPGHPPPLAS
jgi:DNA-binding NtrC family response regulator